MSDPLYAFTVGGKVFDDYLDPDLGTEMALVMSRYYSGHQKAGYGVSYWFVQVPLGVVLDLIEDMGYVAEVRISLGGDDLAVGREMEKCIRRLKAKVESS